MVVKWIRPCRPTRPISTGAVLLACVVMIGSRVGAQDRIPWEHYGRDIGGTRYSPAATIDAGNVARLDVAWSYRTGESEPRFETSKGTAFEATPLVSEGVMYVGTPLGRVIALDAATGEELWTFDPEIRRDVTYGDFASRGVSLWVDSAARPGRVCRRTVFVANAQSQLIALDAETGRPCTGFGDAGRVDLLEGLRIPPFEDAAYTVTSPPVVVNDLVVTGSSIGDNTLPTLPSGEVRAYDARTGALRWSWEPIPQDPLDPAFGDWRGPLAHGTGGGNAWSVLVADAARDLVFVPTGSAAPDYYGALRLGDNRYTNSTVALRASTGEVVWSFQAVHHDLWDYDNAAPPALVTLLRDGRRVPAVVQATKTGMLFVLHRETGEPLFPVDERPVPESRIPGEEASPTQPFSAIAPLSPHHLSLDGAWGANGDDLAACRAMIEPLRNEGIFTPPDTAGTLVLPSNIGGAHWGGVAWDPERRIVVVPVNRIAAEVQLIPRETIDMRAAQEISDREGLGYEYNVMRGTPYIMRRRLLRAPSGLPCTPPPFGALVAVDLDSGEHLWNVPLGSMDGIAPEGVELPEAWGSINLGGPITTAGGLVFVAAALDRSLRAIDIETGDELWRGALPASGKATPMTYQLESGEQYVAIVVGGGGPFGEGDHVVVFGLPGTSDASDSLTPTHRR